VLQQLTQGFAQSKSQAVHVLLHNPAKIGGISSTSFADPADGATISAKSPNGRNIFFIIIPP
jgi:hypothetical protein